MEYLDAATTLIIIAVIVYAIIKQFMAKPVKNFGFVVFPLLALYEAFRSFPEKALPEHQMIECSVMLVLALAAAAIQAFNTEVFYEDDKLFTQARLIAVLTWVAYFLARFAMRYFWNSSGEWTMWLGMAVTFGTRSVILYIRHPEIGKVLAQRSHSGNRRYDHRNRRYSDDRSRRY